MSERKLITCSNDISLENLPTYIKCGKLPFGIYCRRNSVYDSKRGKVIKKDVLLIYAPLDKGKYECNI